MQVRVPSDIDARYVAQSALADRALQEPTKLLAAEFRRLEDGKQ
jgi:hypothetical protein